MMFGSLRAPVPEAGSLAVWGSETLLYPYTRPLLSLLSSNKLVRRNATRR